MRPEKLQQLGAMLQLFTGMNEAFGPDYKGRGLDLQEQGLDINRAELEQRGMESQADTDYRRWLMSEDNPQTMQMQQEMRQRAAMEPYILQRSKQEGLQSGIENAFALMQQGFQPPMDLASPLEQQRRKSAWLQQIMDITGIPFQPQMQTEFDINNLPR